MAETILPREIREEMKQSYVDYAMSVIVGRALPDIHDGLKPVHRRILFAMNDMGMHHDKPFKKCARIVGECFAKNTLVLTERGLVPIQDVKVAEKVYTQNGLKPVSQLYIMPPRPLLKICLDGGLSNIATFSQQFKVLTPDWNFAWKEAKELQPGDYLVTKAAYPQITSLVSLENKKLNINIAYLLGQLISDGWISMGKSRGYHRLFFYSTSQPIIDRIAHIFQEEFSYTAIIEHKEYELPSSDQILLQKAYQIRINKQEINQFFLSQFNLFGILAETKIIPWQILQSPAEIILSFISGLIDGDGSIHCERNVIHYGTISEKLSQQLLILSHHLGFPGQIYKQERIEQVILGRKCSTQKFYNLEWRGVIAQRLAAHLNLADENKSLRAERLRTSRIKKVSEEVIPFASTKIFTELSKYHLGSGWYANPQGEKFRAGIKYPTGSKIRYSSTLLETPLHLSQIIEWGIQKKLHQIGSELSSFIDTVLDNGLLFFPVKEVTPFKEDITYDLQVEDDHEFIANGIISHNCLGKYHPHGDLAVYDALVRMAQDFSLRYPLIKGQGNFGSVDGDSAAAMRYTECRLTPLAEEMLQDLEKDTVAWRDNFDNSLKEPIILPSKVPNLLINGSSGIAVGMATNIPPHNLREVAEAIIATIDNPEIPLIDLFKILPGPDFPTGATIVGRQGLIEAYSSGRGIIELRAVIEQEGSKLIVREIPYMTNKAEMIEHIAEMIKEKRITGIKDLNDESDRDGMRIVLELKKEADSQVVINQLYRFSRLSSSFSINLLTLVDNQPRILNLKELIAQHISFRKDIIVKRTQYDLDQAEKQIHLLLGLITALNNIDAVVDGIKKSRDAAAAQQFLINSFELSEVQAKAILEMKLQRLASLEQQKIKDGHKELEVKAADCRDILGSEKRVQELIKTELTWLKNKYGDERRTKFMEAEGEDIDIEQMIKEEEMVVTLTHSGYVKRLSPTTYRTQKRGGRGITATGVKEEDFVEKLFVASTHDYLLSISSQGQLYWLKVYELPEANRIAKGKNIASLINLSPEETISAIITVREFKEDRYLFMVTKKGTTKKTSLAEFSNPRKAGIRALNIDEGDELISVELTDGKKQIIIATREGLAARFEEGDIRSMGRTAYGVRGIRLEEGDEVIGMVAAEEGKTLLTITEDGYGKRSEIAEYRLINRGGKGVTNIRITGKNGKVVAIKSVTDNDELMLISKNGVAIRMPVKDISVIGRATQGVRVMRLEEGDKIVAAELIAQEENGSEKIE